VTTSLATATVSPQTNWSNGYEALALLDSDKDGRVANKELEPVALWFDTNRDAKVDSGEIRTASSEGITALFFREPLQEGESKDLSLDVGFERVVNGVTETGKSIDWYADVFSSEKEAGEALLAMAATSATNSIVSAKVPEEWMENPGAFRANKAMSHASDVGGYWVWWQHEDKDGEQHPGAFAFHQSPDGTIKGFSVVEAQLGANEAGLRSVVRPMPTVGSSKRLADGRHQIAFNVLDQFGNSAGKSIAELSADGLRLTGRTEQTTEFMKDGKYQSASVSYSWMASKFTEKK
jgi:hypothetical protein